MSHHFSKALLSIAALAASSLPMLAHAAFCEQHIVYDTHEENPGGENKYIYANSNNALHWEVHNKGGNITNVPVTVRDDQGHRRIYNVFISPGQRMKHTFAGLSAYRIYTVGDEDKSLIMVNLQADHSYIEICFAKDASSLP